MLKAPLQEDVLREVFTKYERKLPAIDSCSIFRWGGDKPYRGEVTILGKHIKGDKTLRELLNQEVGPFLTEIVGPSLSGRVKHRVWGFHHFSTSTNRDFDVFNIDVLCFYGALREFYDSIAPLAKNGPTIPAYIETYLHGQGILASRPYTDGLIVEGGVKKKVRVDVFPAR
jgi:hypothetical protein